MVWISSIEEETTRLGPLLTIFCYIVSVRVPSVEPRKLSGRQVRCNRSDEVCER
jgi:hypothetical protein